MHPQFTTFEDARDHVVANMKHSMTGECIDQQARSLLSPALHPMAAAAPSRSDVVAAARALRDHDALIAAARSELEALQVQRAALERKADTVRWQQPRPPRTDTALVDAIVADPDAPLDTAAITAAIEQTSAARVAMDAWDTSRALVDAAIRRVDAQIASAQALVDERVAGRLELPDPIPGRDHYLRSFAKLVNAFLAGQLETALCGVSADILHPMLALSRATDSAHKPLLWNDDVQVSRQCYVETRASDANGWSKERVLLDARYRASVAIDHDVIVAHLLDSMLQDTPE